MTEYLKTAQERPAEDLSRVRDTVREIIDRVKQDGGSCGPILFGEI